MCVSVSFTMTREGYVPCFNHEIKLENAIFSPVFFSLNSVHKKPTITNCLYRKSTNWEEKVRTQGDYVTDMTFDKRKTASGEWSENYGEWVGGCWFFALPCSCSLNSCM